MDSESLALCWYNQLLDINSRTKLEGIQRLDLWRLLIEFSEIRSLDGDITARPKLDSFSKETKALIGKGLNIMDREFKIMLEKH